MLSTFDKLYRLHFHEAIITFRVSNYKFKIVFHRRIQMMTGTAAATLPTSSSVCIIFLIRALRYKNECQFLQLPRNIHSKTKLPEEIVRWTSSFYLAFSKLPVDFQLSFEPVIHNINWSDVTHTRVQTCVVPSLSSEEHSTIRGQVYQIAVNRFLIMSVRCQLKFGVRYFMATAFYGLTLRTRQRRRGCIQKHIAAALKLPTVSIFVYAPMKNLSSASLDLTTSRRHKGIKIVFTNNFLPLKNFTPFFFFFFLAIFNFSLTLKGEKSFPIHN